MVNLGFYVQQHYDELIDGLDKAYKNMKQGLYSIKYEQNDLDSEFVSVLQLKNSKVTFNNIVPNELIETTLEEMLKIKLDDKEGGY